MLLFEEQKVTKNSLRTETRTRSSVDFMFYQLKQSVRFRLMAIGFKPYIAKRFGEMTVRATLNYMFLIIFSEFHFTWVPKSREYFLARQKVYT